MLKLNNVDNNSIPELKRNTSQARLIHNPSQINLAEKLRSKIEILQ